jgi:hypothetical protein
MKYCATILLSAAIVHGSELDLLTSSLDGLLGGDLLDDLLDSVTDGLNTSYSGTDGGLLDDLLDSVTDGLNTSSYTYSGTDGGIFDDLFDSVGWNFSSSYSYDASLGDFFDEIGDAFDNLVDLQEYMTCVSNGVEIIASKIAGMTLACDAIGLARYGAAGAAGLMSIPSLDFASIGGNSTELFEKFCYEQTDCKEAFQDMLYTYVTEFGRCFGRLGDDSLDGMLSELREMSGDIDELCPILTYRLVATFTMSGTLEDYNTDEAKARIIQAVAAASGLAFAPLATVTLTAGSVVATVSIPVASEDQATTARSTLVSEDIGAALTDAGFDSVTVDSSSLVVEVEEQNPGMSTGVLIAIIAGGAAGGIVLLILIIVLVCCCTKRRSVEPAPADVEGQVIKPVKSKN